MSCLVKYLLLLVLVQAQLQAESWEPVPPVDFQLLNTSDFSDLELDVPAYLIGSDYPLTYYLNHFHTLANAVVEDGPNRGFIDLSVWRNQEDNTPFNARVMENILSLAYFYSTDRPWNPYVGSSAVRDRLEASLEFWMSIQHENGPFSEHDEGKYILSATAFATKFMSQTLRLLRQGPGIEPNLLSQVDAAQRKAIIYALNNNSYFNQGKQVTNQYGNLWGAALAWLSDHDDPEMETKLNQRFAESRDVFQSPAGYYYELERPDFGYNLGTHQSNERIAWNYARGTAFGEQLVEDEQELFEWLSYNAVPTRDGTGFILNRTIETRKQITDIPRIENPLAEFVENARPFVLSASEIDTRRQAFRADAETYSPDTAPLVIGNFSAYSPYGFLHREDLEWHPTDIQRQAAAAELPYIAETQFTHQRSDSLHDTTFTYVRRPGYYATYTGGELINQGQRFGLGLLWHPVAGALFQNQTFGTTTAWGTQDEEATLVHEANSFNATYLLDGVPFIPETGNHDLAEGQIEVSYDLGTEGHKTITFGQNGIQISVTHADRFFEYLPLLIDPLP